MYTETAGVRKAGSRCRVSGAGCQVSEDWGLGVRGWGLGKVEGRREYRESGFGTRDSGRKKRVTQDSLFNLAAFPFPWASLGGRKSRERDLRYEAMSKRRNLSRNRPLLVCAKSANISFLILEEFR